MGGFNKIFIVSVMIFGLVGILFLGSGITGKVTLDSTVKPLCSSDKDCSSPEVCCLFNNQEAGVCNQASVCPSIKVITQNSGTSEDQTINNYVNERPQKNIEYNLEIVIGFLILLVAAFCFYVTYKNSGKSGKKKKKILKKSGKKKKSSRKNRK